jgi:hypothetical protein
MVFEVEEQLEFEFMKEKPKPVIVQRQERYYEYMKRMHRDADERERLNEN